METLFIGKNLLFLPEVESTNTYAMNLLRNVNTIDGTVVYTDHQTEGKGQRGAAWTSGIASNITLSVVLKPQFLNIDASFFLSKISALAVYDVLTDILPIGQYDIKIKWPNDILVNHHKIAGILIENVFNSLYFQYSVIGIGINVNQTQFNVSGKKIASLKTLLQMEVDRKKVMDVLCEKLEKWYLQLRTKQFEHITQNYMSHLHGLNETLAFEDAFRNKFRGTIMGVTPDGKLMIQTLDSGIQNYDVKEIIFL